MGDKAPLQNSQIKSSMAADEFSADEFSCFISRCFVTKLSRIFCHAQSLVGEKYFCCTVAKGRIFPGERLRD
jgi:hypothetical protein